MAAPTATKAAAENVSAIDHLSYSSDPSIKRKPHDKLIGASQSTPTKQRDRSYLIALMSSGFLKASSKTIRTMRRRLTILSNLERDLSPAELNELCSLRSQDCIEGMPQRMEGSGRHPASYTLTAQQPYDEV
jgi:hypothetical protein